MRSTQAMKNMLANIFLQLAVFLSGIILPGLFIKAYGSDVNGMILSANNFLMCLSLAEAGVGAASIIALYSPLAYKDTKQMNAVLSATKKFYEKSGLIFGLLLVGLIGIYPVDQLSPFLVRGMLFVLGLTVFVDYFFLGKYKVLLQANQQGYILSLIEMAGTFFTLGISVILISFHINVVLIKAITTLVFIIRFFIVRIYVKKKYPEVNFHVEPDFAALHQRGAALVHQVAGIVVNNTDVVLLLTFMGNRRYFEVSVYGIYNMVSGAINMLLFSVANGLTAGFGEVISKKEEDTLKRSFSNYEYGFFLISFICCACMLALILPFVAVYTKDARDVDYVRPIVAALFVIIVFLQNIRVPGLTMVNAAGHFKETKKQAIIEMILHSGVSLALIHRFGMEGVLLGTVCSFIYRSTAIIFYNGFYLVKTTLITTGKRLLRNMLLLAGIGVVSLKLIPQLMNSFLEWVLYAGVTGIVSMCLFCGLNYLFEPEEFKAILERVSDIFKRNFKHF